MHSAYQVCGSLTNITLIPLHDIMLSSVLKMTTIFCHYELMGTSQQSATFFVWSVTTWEFFVVVVYSAMSFISCKLIHHQDNSIHTVTTTFFMYPLTKQKPLIKDLFHMQAL